MSVSAKLVSCLPSTSGNGFDGKIELTTSKGIWVLDFTSIEPNKTQAKVDFQQQLYDFAVEIAKEFGTTTIKI